MRELLLPLLTALATTLLALALPTAAAAPGEAGLPLLRIHDVLGQGGAVQTWAIVQDRRGVMYFGSTDNGVIEFDGVGWRMITTPGRSTIRSLALGADGRVYVGGVGEIGYLAPDGQGIMRYMSLLERVPEDQRDFGDVWSTYASADGVIFSSFKRLIRIGRDGTRVWDAGSAFHSAHMARDRLYVREVGRGLLELVDDRLRLIPEGERLAGEKVAAVFAWPEGDGSDRGALLIGTRTQGFFRLAEGRLTPWPTDADAELSAAEFYSGTRLADGRLVAATLLGGIFLFDAQARLVGRIDKSGGLPGPTVYALKQDRQGGLWMALDEGVARAEVTEPLTRFNALNGLEGGVIALRRHRGILYAGTMQGLYRLRENRGRAAHFEPVPEVTGPVWALLGIDDALLAGGMRGVHELRRDGWRLVRPSAQTATSLQRSRLDPRRVYVGMSDGLATMRLQAAQWIDEGAVQGLHEEVRGIFEHDDGRLWLGTPAAGAIELPLLRDGALDPLAAGRARRFGVGQGLPPGPAFVYEIGGEPAFATIQGVFRFDAATARFGPDPRFTGLFGSQQREVFGLTEDGSGRVWMFSQDAARTTLESGAAVPVDARASRYRWDSGPLVELAGVGQSVFVVEEDAIWIGGDQGLIRLDPKRTPSGHQPFEAVVRRVVGRDGKLHFGGSGQPAPPAIESTHNALRFEFAAPAYGQRPHRYQVLLEGLERQWSAPMAEPYLDYTNLREGDYRFRVRAINAYGRISSEGEWGFRVLPPWYRTPLAYLAWTLAAVLVMFGLAGWRSAALRARNRQLAGLVATRTRELSEANRALQAANASLAELSLTDALTGLRNRRYLAERIAEDVAALRRSHTQAGLLARGAAVGRDAQLVLIMIDIDEFKQINDHCGHESGDRVLEQFGSILRGICRDTDTAVRWGGEEFLLVVRQSPVEDGMALAERIRAQVAAHRFVLDDGRELRCSCSLGFAGFPLYPAAPDRTRWEISLRLADQCLYEAKRRGRNTWVGVRPAAGSQPGPGLLPATLAEAVSQGWLELLQMPGRAEALAAP